MNFESVRTGYLTDEQFKDVYKELDEFKFKSGLSVFSDHFGLRPGEVHTIVGTKGSGKSTWCKTILSDLVYDDKNVMLYISEEDVSKYMASLNKTFRMLSKHPDDTKKYLDRIIVVSEMETKLDNEPEFFRYIETLLE